MPCPVLGVKSPVVLSLQTLCVTGRHLGMKEGCNLCFSYIDGAPWGYGVAGGSGSSQSLCCLVLQPCECSDTSSLLMLPPRVAICFNAVSVLGEIWRPVQGELDWGIIRLIFIWSGKLLTDGPVFSHGLPTVTDFLPATEAPKSSILHCQLGSVVIYLF